MEIVIEMIDNCVRNFKYFTAQGFLVVSKSGYGSGSIAVHEENETLAPLGLWYQLMTPF